MGWTWLGQVGKGWLGWTGLYRVGQGWNGCTVKRQLKMDATVTLYSQTQLAVYHAYGVRADRGVRAD